MCCKTDLSTMCHVPWLDQNRAGGLAMCWINHTHEPVPNIARRACCKKQRSRLDAMGL